LQSHSNQIQSTPKEEKTSESSVSDAPKSSPERSENEKLLDQVLSKIDKPSLSRSLSEHIVVD